MNILITGNLSSLTTTFVREFIQHKHRLVLASNDADQLQIRSSKTIVHSVNPADPIFFDAISSYGFDIVIFIATREEQLFKGNGGITGQELDGLRNTLELCKAGKPKHFFYLSSTEVYGVARNGSEDAEPQPASINGHTLYTGEQYCRIYHGLYGVNTTIIRLPNIYGPEEASGLLYSLLMDCNHMKEAYFPAGEDTQACFLHALDVTDFLIRAMDEESSSEMQVIHLPSSGLMKYSDLAQLLQKCYPTIQCNFRVDSAVYTQPVEGTTARRVFDWIDTHTFAIELKSLVEKFSTEVQPEKHGSELITRKLSNYPEILKWVELIGGVFVVQFLSQMTGTLIQFKYVDFRLLFVVIMGSVYGIKTGLYAAVLVSISILYTWVQLGFDWALLVYNVGNWLPFAMYFTAGLITGYYHDKSENQILNAEKQTRLISDKYTFLYGVFNDIRKLKDEFRERLLGYRDSFGKIFTITQELDHLQEHAIYLRALTILEEQMDNRNIAIYTVDPDGHHARLEASSMSMNGSLKKSISLSNYSEILPCVQAGSIFQNTSLLQNYPAYLVPIFNNECPGIGPTVLIALWSVKFEQHSTYYYNRLKVICGLIQASLVRAAMFSNANYEKMHLPATRILNHHAFMDELTDTRGNEKEQSIRFSACDDEEPQQVLAGYLSPHF